jgi:hypothetical protein
MASRERDRRRGARSTAEPRSRWHGPVARASGTGQWKCRVCADAMRDRCRRCDLRIQRQCLGRVPGTAAQREARCAPGAQVKK